MFSLTSHVDAKYVDAKPYGSSSGSLRVYIPSIMPQVAMGTPRITPVSLNKACFINAEDCKPSVASMIDTQNYVTAKAPYTPYENPCYYYGRDLKVIPKSSDFLSCQLNSDEEDNSVNWPKNK